MRALLKDNQFNITLIGNDGLREKVEIPLSKPVEYLETELFMTERIICAQKQAYHEAAFIRETYLKTCIN